MSTDSEIVKRHVSALIEETKASGTPTDVVGRMLIQEAIELWNAERDWQDIASELKFMADNLDPDLDYEFMRP